MRLKSAPGPRIFAFLAAAAFHLGLLLFTVFTAKTGSSPDEAPPGVMKLADIREESPSPLPPRRPPSPSPSPAPPVGAAETFAPPEDDGGGEENTAESAETGLAGKTGDGETDFLSMYDVSELPRFSEEEIRSRIVYPPTARRAGIEGTVYLELFVDNRGLVRNGAVLRENPAGRGFGEAALKAFEGLKGEPARANGRNVAVRYRYPVRFRL
ncbi:MAG: energy transducer TonB [Treponema sp.]|jgi:protein TonB|nr:energy transducer TonB [Treponema sp.]